MDKVLRLCEEITENVGACERCGKCCKSPPLLPEDMKRLGKYAEMFNENGACPFFVEGKCEIYEIRPIVCRIYPFMLLPQGLFLINIQECKLGREIYRILFPDEREERNIVKVAITKLEEMEKRMINLRNPDTLLMAKIEEKNCNTGDLPKITEIS